MKKYCVTKNRIVRRRGCIVAKQKRYEGGKGAGREEIIVAVLVLIECKVMRSLAASFLEKK